jgi:uncharacterized phiE125 gp8 family phage protein
MGLTLITPPAAEPISASEAKASPSLRVSASTDDTDITMLIKAARIQAENYTLHALVTQTLELVLDAFPTGGIELPMPPLQSVTSIKYIDDDGVEQTLGASLYSVDTDTIPGLITPAYDETWPTDVRDQINAVRVRYVAGFGAASDVPEDIRTWIKMRVGTLYDNPQAVVLSNLSKQAIISMPHSFIDGLLDNYRYAAIRF